MGRHEAEPHLPRAEGARTVVSHHLAGCVREIADIPVYSLMTVDVSGYESCYFWRGEEVVGVENSDHIARCHADTFVHGVVDTLVGFAHPSQSPLVAGLVAADDFDGIVARPSVYDYVLNVAIALREHALDGVDERRGTVEAGCDYTYFHVIPHLIFQ